MPSPLFRQALRTVLPYSIFGALWIWSSDRGLEYLVSEPALRTQISIYKGWAFIAITSLLLLWLVWRRLHINHNLQRQLSARQQEIEEYLISVSHHLRTPLVSIGIHSGEMLSAHNAGETLEAMEATRHLEGIEQSSKAMDTLLSDLGRLHRTLRFQPVPGRVDAEPIVRAIFSECLSLYGQDKEIHLQLGRLPAVWADSQQFTAMLAELITNSFRHYMGGTPLHIEVAGSRHFRKAMLTIADNGCGFALSNTEYLFHPLRRPPHATSTGHMPLGLAIAWRCAQWNGGELKLESSPGNGTKAWITLPTP